MIEIAAANENAVVRQIDDTRSTNIDGFPGSKPSGRTFSPLPSLETLSLSTTTSSVVNNHLKYSGAGNNGNDDDIHDDNDNGCELNDCSSSVSSQYSDNANASRNPPKRSVFSQYWKKTGQKPVPLRPVKLISTPNLLQRIPPGLTQESSPLTAAADSPGSTSAYSVDDHRAIRSMSNADFLEDDDDSCCRDVPAASRQVTLEFPAPHAPSPSSPSKRRRSILPPAPRSHPALKKSTIAKGSQSWRKSLSLSSVEEYSRMTTPALDTEHKTQSLPRMRSTGSQPLHSCFRPNPKYSLSKSDSASRKRLDLLSLLSSHTISESGSSSSLRPGMLLRTESCSSTGSSVSFLEAVDVRHFEPPRQHYAGQGWSDYFK